MFYYLVDKIGTGTAENSFRPNIPMDTAYVSYEKDTKYLIATNNSIPGLTALTNAKIKSQAANMGITSADTAIWFIGD